VITLDEALNLIEQKVSLFYKNLNRIKKVKLMESLNYLTAEDIYSKYDIPEYDNSAMDGIAVSTIKEEYFLQDYTNNILHNNAVEINTGQKIPDNTLTIIEKENYEIINNIAKIKDLNKVKPYKNIRKKGEEIKKGQLVINKNTLITPQVIGILAKIGMHKIKVFLPPRIGIIITGSELVEIGTEKKDNQIFNSNGPLLISLLKQTFCTQNFHFSSPKLRSMINKYKLVEDNYKKIKSTIYKFLQNVDILIITGGASVGKYDYSAKALEDINAQKIFHKVSIKPGKPVYFYIYQNKLIFGFPGNPLAVFTLFHLFLKPTLKYFFTKKFDLNLIDVKNYEIVINEEFVKGSTNLDEKRINIVPAFLSNYSIQAFPVGSNQLLPLINANCLLIIEKKKVIPI